jgi:phosphate transport system permease protein
VLRSRTMDSEIVRQNNRQEKLMRGITTGCGLLIIALTLAVGGFLIIRGTVTFTVFRHSVSEFLFSPNWDPVDSAGGYGGHVGAAVYICGSLMTCALALLIALPFSLAAAVFMTEISPRVGAGFLQPTVEIFVGIPSVVYGWVGLTVLVPFIKNVFHAPMGGFSVLAAGIVLSVMIFPTITTISADAMRAVPQSMRTAAYGMGATRWQMIRGIVIPTAGDGILTGVITGLSRAFGEALAVAMVIGKTRAFPKNILYPTSNLTAAIAADMGNTASGGEYNQALWTMALFLLLISLFFIILIHLIPAIRKRRAES